MTSLNFVTFRLFFVPGGGGGTIHMTGQCTEDVVVCGGDYFSPVSDRGCCVVILTVVSICLFSHNTGQVWPYIAYRRTWLKSMHVNIVYCARTRSFIGSAQKTSKMTSDAMGSLFRNQIYR